MECPYSSQEKEIIDGYDLEDDLDFDDEYISAYCLQPKILQSLRQRHVPGLITSDRFAEWVIEQRAGSVQSSVLSFETPELDQSEACRQCQTYNEGDWVACDTKCHGSDISTHWYHSSCVGLTIETIPEGIDRLRIQIENNAD